MVAAPSSVATRRMDSAASPSASARPRAACTIRSLDSSPSGARGCRRAAGARWHAGSATTVPTPDTARTSPSWRRVASTLVAVAMATPHSWVIRRAEGTRSPGRSSPSLIRRRISPAIRR